MVVLGPQVEVDALHAREVVAEEPDPDAVHRQGMGRRFADRLQRGVEGAAAEGLLLRQAQKGLLEAVMGLPGPLSLGDVPGDRGQRRDATRVVQVDMGVPDDVAHLTAHADLAVLEGAVAPPGGEAGLEVAPRPLAILGMDEVVSRSAEALLGRQAEEALSRAVGVGEPPFRVDAGQQVVGVGHELVEDLPGRRGAIRLGELLFLEFFLAHGAPRWHGGPRPLSHRLDSTQGPVIR